MKSSIPNFFWGDKLHKIGLQIIEYINKKYAVSIELSEENSKDVEDMCSEFAAELGMRDCDDCEKKRH